MGYVLVELLVLLVGDLAARPHPQCLRLIDRLVLRGFLAFFAHQHRKAQVVRVALDQGAQSIVVGELLGVRLQVQDDTRAALRARQRLDREIALRARFPAHRCLRRCAGLAREHFYALGDDEGRVEADPELPDELRVLLLVARERLEELRRPRLRDRAEVGDRLLARHPDAVIPNGERARRRITVHPYGELCVLAEQLRLGNCLKAQAIVGIRGIGDQLAQEDLPMAVQGMDHQLEELAHLGLKAECLFRVLRHARGFRKSSGRYDGTGRSATRRGSAACHVGNCGDFFKTRRRAAPRARAAGPYVSSSRLRAQGGARSGDQRRGKLETLRLAARCRPAGRERARACRGDSFRARKPRRRPVAFRVR